jgi:hypothetical protein
MKPVSRRYLSGFMDDQGRKGAAWGLIPSPGLKRKVAHKCALPEQFTKIHVRGYKDHSTDISSLSVPLTMCNKRKKKRRETFCFATNMREALCLV